ncbi:MAG: deoxyribodipyrimidine photo-lyase [Pseudomonadota bacterium]
MTTPKLFWFRRDLRLEDNPGLHAAAETGGPVIPVFILDPETEALGAAHRWRLGAALEVFAETLSAAGSRLICRRGKASEVLQSLIEDTGATAVHWSRTYDPTGIARDTAVKAGLADAGVEAKSHAGHVLFEPWRVQTQQDEFYKVYTPFWKSVRDRDPGGPLSVPKLPAPETWPQGVDVAALDLGSDMRRGAAVVARYAKVGTAAAEAKLDAFMDGPLAAYGDDRDRLDRDGTSGLSDNLALGEISARQIWAGVRAAMEHGQKGAETYLKEIVWRDFAYHLLYHTPRIATENWRPEWDGFPWKSANDQAEAWRRGRTGEPVIDAAMRQLYVTGTMHNRARMLVASYLTKHLLIHWRVGLDWFADCLIDWDPASNAMGWQWAAGSGPDAAPYFRIFNPATQAEKFDPDGAYRRRYVAELSDDPGAQAQAFYAAIPERWDMSPNDTYPDGPLIDLKKGRERALAAYEDHRSRQSAA